MKREIFSRHLEDVTAGILLISEEREREFLNLRHIMYIPVSDHEIV